MFLVYHLLFFIPTLVADISAYYPILFYHNNWNVKALKRTCSFQGFVTKGPDIQALQELNIQVPKNYF